AGVRVRKTSSAREGRRSLRRVRLGVVAAAVVLAGDAAPALARDGWAARVTRVAQAGAAEPAEGTAPSELPPQQPSQLRFAIDEFRVDGAVSMAQQDVEAAVYAFLGPDRTSDDVDKARAALEKAYHDKGFQTVSVSVPAQNVGSGTVVLAVTEA